MRRMRLWLWDFEGWLYLQLNRRQRRRGLPFDPVIKNYDDPT